MLTLICYSAGTGNTWKSGVSLSTSPIRGKDPKEQTFVFKSFTRKRKIMLLKCGYCMDCDSSAKEGIVEMVRENRANGRKIEKLGQRYVGRRRRTGHNQRKQRNRKFD